ncbi:MAG: phosphate ABC transporter permease PstA [Planctomycetes bacterium]|nr:phosphate ABC transporter permease PstA [Planctomycetota bacterium]
MTPSTLERPVEDRAPARRWRTSRRTTALSALGEPWLWLAGGALAFALAMIAGLVTLILVRGLGTFWPAELVQIERVDAPTLLGEVASEETVLRPAADGTPEHPARPERLERRRMFRTGNFDVTGQHFEWVWDSEIVRETRPEHALAIERTAWGRFHGEPVALVVGRVTIAEEPAEILDRFDAVHERARAEPNGDAHLRVRSPEGTTKDLPLAEIVRAYPANQLGWAGKFGVYLSRWWEFLTDVPREANSEGGVFPAIFGTVVMTLLMALVVVPFGVLAALYLREYAKPGVLVDVVRICVNNLAGVPSIVFGVFGLGFFCMIVGTSIDALLFSDRLPNPTYGKGGLLWASLTLALLTLPVVIVATEEAIAAVPNSMREGSYGCGATKGQTILRIVLPRALPGIMTGMILAIARGAGEVAPLMLVGAVKLAPQLAVDGTAPFVHPERSFLHLGFHVFDLGFQSQNSAAAMPMVYTTTLLLLGIVVTLNLSAIWIRARLRKKFSVSPF